jgi:hypothetical protein
MRKVSAFSAEEFSESQRAWGWQKASWPRAVRATRSTTHVYANHRSDIAEDGLRIFAALYEIEDVSILIKHGLVVRTADRKICVPYDVIHANFDLRAVA